MSRTGVVVLVFVACAFARAESRQFSGVYPHLAFFNDERECGTGAVVPWADRLWAITYAPHSPSGSSDKLYEIDSDLNIVVRPESVGGTCANRLIHRESNQLFIGPYAIDAQRNVRVIPYAKMVGRMTATMRHLTDPANRVYFATMEEGFYDVDVKTLDVKTMFPDGNTMKELANALLPGYHGKGAYTSQGRIVYANNGERSPEAKVRPDVPSGCLAEWDGKDWRVVRRNQFCDVTGPGGIEGAANPTTDPIWSIGWDHRSLILMLLDGGEWHSFRLPKATHTYDGAHGWNTEWPRIRDIGEDDLLMTMHGMLWRFPRTFSVANNKGIRPRSTYLKVIGDFARWNDSVVFGCDDTAKSEFLNKRAAKGELAPPGQSQSNLWFVPPDALDRFGPARADGAVWLNDDVKAGEWSEPFLFAGFERRIAHLTHRETEPVKFTLQIDEHPPRTVIIGPREYRWTGFSDKLTGEWIRVKTDRDCAGATVIFSFSNSDHRGEEADAMFDGIAKVGEPALGGIVWAGGENKRTLQLAGDAGSYELGDGVDLAPLNDPAADEWLRKNAAIPRGVLSLDKASVIYVDDAKRRWRLPRGDESFDEMTRGGAYRVAREVCTERDLFNCHGTFYELPADNAGGFSKVRPIATHNRPIIDYCSYRGLLILTGIADTARGDHIIVSGDGKAALWAGVVDDLWELGKSRGRGGPWKDSNVKANVASDPYLLNGFDEKHLTVTTDRAANVRVEVDLTGDGHWVTYATLDLSQHTAGHQFPAGYNGYWLRVTADVDCVATAWLEYR
jgi:hypothetical protein